jgi:SOS-response transcriptional repressor LexA
MPRIGDQMDIKDRLLMFVNALDIKRSEFAKTIEVTPGNLSDWLNRKKTSKPSPPAMARINEHYGLNLNWLMTGKGGMFVLDADGNLYGDGHKKSIEELTGNSSVYQHKLNPFDSRNITLPIYGEIAAGAPRDGYDGSPSKYIEIPKAYLSDQENKYLALKVNGNSMFPKIAHGDVVVIRENIDIPSLNGKVCACHTHEGATLKKLQFDKEKKRVILKPLNPDYDIIIIEEYELETFRILGEMVFLFRVV